MMWLETCSSGDLKRYQIISIALQGNAGIVDWLFKKNKPEMIASDEEILALSGANSSGERILIKFAVDVWFNTQHCNFFEVVRVLDDTNFRNVMVATTEWRKL